MEYTLDFNIEKAPFKINHKESYMLIGSCFSDEIGNRMRHFAFSNNSNPFGTIFHPIAIANTLIKTIERVPYTVFQKKDIYLCWDTASTFFDLDKSKFHNKLTELAETTYRQLTETSVLFITFGTAWAYHLIENDSIVANCHKMPGNLFQKKLTETSVIVAQWKEVIKKIKTLQPKINIVFTVSPVRHIKDGLIENNQSKAILIEVVRQLTKENNDLFYFPSYEIVIDQLRDYRFYKEDKVHPSKEAIDFVWKSFETCFCDTSTLQLNHEIDQLQKLKNHTSLHSGSEEDLLFKESTQKKIRAFQSKHPHLLL